MKQLTKNVPAESELLFGYDLNKRISQMKNTNSALAKPAFRPNQNNGSYNKNQAPYNTTSNQKTDVLPERALLQGEGGTTGTKLSKLW